MANDNEFIMYDKSGNVGIPQHKNVNTGKYEPSKGDKNAPFSMIVNENGSPISSTNKLPVDVSFPATQNVQLTGSNVDIPVKLNGSFGTLETIVNAQSIVAGGAVQTSLEMTGKEKEVWVMILIDQQPWTLKGTYATTQGGYDASAFYPLYNNHTNTYTNVFVPATSLYMSFKSSLGIPAPTSIKEAKELLWYNHNGFIRVENDSANTATVTIKVMRIWKDGVK